MLGWPRTYTRGGDTIVLYQPQIDAWRDHSMIKFRSAVAVTPAGAREATYGVVAVQADTSVNSEAGTVVMRNLQPATFFPSLTPAQAAPLQALVLEMLPSRPSIELPLSQVLSHLHHQAPPPAVAVNLEPPPIFHSDSAAIMVIFLGQPQFKPVAGTQLQFAVNTNWPLFLDPSQGRYFLLDGSSWMTAPDPLNGPWAPAAQLPAGLSNLPASGGWADVSANVPGQPFAVVPQVFTSTVPAELIVTNGPPNYVPIPGTQLTYTSNPVTPLFFSVSDNSFYYLSAGRWFRAPDLTGPWSSASNNLPADFARIPADSPVGFVLASVPGTPQAADAVLLAQIPHKATLNIADLSCNVVYNDGSPRFSPIAGTSMQYATNTPFQVIAADGQYYCCHEGVWFNSPGPGGPWAVSTSVPGVIYTIPPSSPVYNTTYVQVYGSTPSTVVVGYTGGYTGQYVAANGVLMFGAGLATGALLAGDSCCWGPCYYSYGCGACYNGFWGAYGGACHYYGPYGSAAWGARYNPATGTYSRAGYASGPYGSAGFHQAYNPWTDSYAGHASGTNGYSHWGGSTVSQGNQWASAAHATGPGGVTRGAATDSSGQWAEGVRGPGDNSVARTSGGDTYAGHDGNVYRKTSDGTYQKYDGSGNWSNTSFQGRGSMSSSSVPAGGWQGAAGGVQNDWKNNWNADASRSQWQNSMNQRPQGGWQDDASRASTEGGLNNDAFARNWGNNESGSWGTRGDWGNASRSWGGRSGWGGGSSSWGSPDRSFGGGAWGAGGRAWGGRGGFRR